jgi:hypothetical protein
MSSEPIKYDLRPAKEYDALLTSPALDPLMHPAAKVPVIVNSQRNVADARCATRLDPFQRESLHEYLRLQQYVRETLERELPRDQEQWDPEGEPVCGDVWSWVRVHYLEIRPLNVPEPSEVKRWSKSGLSDDEIARILAASDTPQTRSFFRITLRCDWDTEHPLEAEFRDGAFVKLLH